MYKLYIIYNFKLNSNLIMYNNKFIIHKIIICFTINIVKKSEKE